MYMNAPPVCAHARSLARRALPQAGKSTLLKLMVGDLSPCVGTVSRHPHLSMGRYYQHSVDQLKPEMTVRCVCAALCVLHVRCVCCTRRSGGAVCGRVVWRAKPACAALLRCI